MSDPLAIGSVSERKIERIMELFAPVEGVNSFYYGKIGNGKTSTATADILELLNRGEIVWANWKVNWDGFDERTSISRVFFKFFFGKDVFFRYGAENFHYFHPDDIDVSMLGRLVNVHIFIDEGQWIFNSHDRTDDPDKRKLVLHGRHYCRSLNILSQRPSNVFKDMRSQIHVWYKCEKVLGSPFLLFRKTEFQDMKDDLPDEDVDDPKVRYYFMSKAVQSAYDTHAMRASDAIVPEVSYRTIHTTFVDRFMLLVANLLPALGRTTAKAGGDATGARRSIRDVKRG